MAYYFTSRTNEPSISLPFAIHDLPETIGGLNNNSYNPYTIIIVILVHTHPPQSRLGFCIIVILIIIEGDSFWRSLEKVKARTHIAAHVYVSLRSNVFVLRIYNHSRRIRTMVIIVRRHFRQRFAHHLVSYYLSSIFVYRSSLSSSLLSRCLWVGSTFEKEGKLLRLATFNCDFVVVVDTSQSQEPWTTFLGLSIKVVAS